MAGGNVASVKAGRTRRDQLAAAQIANAPQRARGKAEQRIRDATERLLGDVRASDLKIEDILAEAEVSRRTFYSYYESKYGVIAGLAMDTLEEAYPHPEPFFSGVTPDEQRAALRAGIARACGVWAQHRGVLRAVVEHWHSVPELRTMSLELIYRLTEEIAAEIDSQREAGHAPEGVDSRLIAQMLIWSGAYTIYVAGLSESIDIPDENSIVDPVVASWHVAVYGP